MPLLPGAEPYRHEGGPVGVLVVHGFTGSPQSMRPWAERAAEAGLSVSMPLLPGHGTHWRDLNLTRWTDWYGTVERSFDELRDRCERVFVFALSMGGTLALHLAAQRGPQVAGLVLVNPLVVMPGRAHVALPVVRHLVSSLPGIGSDIAKPDTAESGYDRTPLHAAHSMKRLTLLVRRELPEVRQPVLLFRSTEDHVVSAASGRELLAKIGSAEVEERLLEHSYHVATLDHDAGEIFDGSLAFVRTHSAPLVPDAGA